MSLGGESTAKEGKLVVISGPSGVGKGTVLRLLYENGAVPSVSCATRQPREGEVDGVSYFFISREKFLEMIENDEFLEYNEYGGNHQFYGTPARFVEEQLSEGKNVVLEIDPRGAMQIRKRRPDAVLIFIAPPSIEELERRLRGRGTETEEQISARMKTAQEELTYSEKYDYTLVNDTIEQTFRDILSIIDAESQE